MLASTLWTALPKRARTSWTDDTHEAQCMLLIRTTVIQPSSAVLSILSLLGSTYVLRGAANGKIGDRGNARRRLKVAMI